MKIGFMSAFDRERIEFARKHGFGCVELLVRDGSPPFVPPHDGWQARADEVKAAYDQAGITVACVGGYYVNHMDADPAKARAAHDHARNLMLLAERMGVGCTAGFAGKLIDKPLFDSLPVYKTIWSEHARFAEDHGVKIAFEHCPMGWNHLPPGGNNCMCTPEFWEKAFNEVPSKAIGLEWDPSHLIGMFIDPVENIRQFGDRIYHVHAKDAKVNRFRLARYGIFAGGSVEHCFAGFGDTDWAAVIKELNRAGYNGDLNIEGWHDAVYRNHRDGPQREDAGLVVSLKYLSQFIA